MRYIPLILAVIFISSCDPNEKDIFNLESLKINGTLADTSAVIKLGDTVTLSVQLPDIILTNNNNFTVTSLQKAQFYMDIAKVDTVGKKYILVPRAHYWTSQGKVNPINQMDFEFNTDVKPYGVTIHFKPEEKGIYILGIVPQAGQTKINNTYSPRLHVDFSVANRNIYLAESFFGSTWASQARSGEFGIYVFRVN